MKLEICANSMQSAINAQLGGAHRIELCANLEGGGTTPDAATIQLASHILQQSLNKQPTKVYVLIRPRIGNFCYSPLELGQMKRNILYCKAAKVNGIVTGVLDNEGKVDMQANAELLQVAFPLKATFHRAFDRIENKSEALEQIIELGFERILTSGGEASALEGKEMIAQLVRQAAGRISIMPGAGINSKNIEGLITATSANEYHLSAKKVIYPMGQPDQLFETPYWETDIQEVQRVMRILNR